MKVFFIIKLLSMVYSVSSIIDDKYFPLYLLLGVSVNFQLTVGR